MNEPNPKRKGGLRWPSLGEMVAILAVVIAGLGYWDNRRDRAEERAQQAELKAGAAPRAFLMTGTPSENGGRIALASAQPDQVIQTQTLHFPTAVRDDPIQTTGNPRIERDWFAGGLKKALRDVPRGDEAKGRVPVGVVTVFIEDGKTRTDRAIYRLGYGLQDRLLRGDAVELEGLSLVRRGVTGDLQAAVDAMWPKPAPPAAKPGTEPLSGR